jgi:hypothetical protein
VLDLYWSDHHTTRFQFRKHPFNCGLPAAGSDNQTASPASRRMFYHIPRLVGCSFSVVASRRYRLGSLGLSMKANASDALTAEAGICVRRGGLWAQSKSSSPLF